MAARFFRDASCQMEESSRWHLVWSDPVLVRRREAVCVFPQDADNTIWVPKRLVRAVDFPVQKPEDRTEPRDQGDTAFSPEPTLEDIRCLHTEFAVERDWEHFHQPWNLLLALVGEVGKLAELFQWKSDAEPGPQAWLPKERVALQEELSNVFIYLVALAARCRVDLPRAVIAKIDTNQRRYPVHLSRGSACKYTDLPHGAIPENQAVGAAEPNSELQSQAYI
ncbi:dCTP pyrophosphatase 1-like [Chionomys nivalis]|uniref:dCTP pyrophosphatase 1-like n=1 Tax=Chionomys nivalis TaxID=269649 RepID=UPI0025965724|nr:dCTP pyrophosphatase 1-like [Chionomys nivalis]